MRSFIPIWKNIFWQMIQGNMICMESIFGLTIMRWFAMPVGTQIANIGGEIERALRWKNRNDHEKMMNFYRKAIELLRLTEEDPKNKHRVHELQSFEEELADYFLGENFYQTTEETLRKYYDAFL